MSKVQIERLSSEEKKYEIVAGETNSAYTVHHHKYTLITFFMFNPIDSTFWASVATGSGL